MNIEDLRALGERTRIDTDLCLIGSGPAGWTISEEFRNTGLRILMLESGGPAVDPETAALNEVEDVGTPLFNGRARALGGTSVLWHGWRCVPLEDIDYEQRPWVPRSGWPFGAETMAPYVNRASEHFGAGPYFERHERRPMPGGLRLDFDPALLRSAWWQLPTPVNFGQVLATRPSPNLWVLLRATVTQLNTDPYGRRIESVEVADANGRRLTVHARAVVLCAGGIENPRILLYSNRINPNGVGNQHDLVGRYLMDHPRDFELIARAEPADMERFRSMFGPRNKVCDGYGFSLMDGPRGRHEFSYGFSLSPEWQRAEGLLNAAAWPFWNFADSPAETARAPDDPFDALKRLAKGPRDRALRDAWRVVSQPGLLRSRLETHRKTKRDVERRGFLVSSEQVPDPDSRVQLSGRRDRLGLPLARTDWRTNELEARSQAVLAQTIAAEFMRLGLFPLRLADWVREGRFGDAKFVDGCHPSGTTRMADDPRDGVVDANCQVYGVDRLYVAGSSVFPTNSHANPTLMIVALAVRLAEHLKERFHPKASAGATGRMPVLASD
ncbi:MAG TPA: GMC family oxidoreductase [Crenalkalicoccus sp.]|nr:GMC family oxidoreductase [Crenalkalicoccus sp.]